MPVVVMDPLVKDEPLSYVVTNGYEGSADAVSYLVSIGASQALDISPARTGSSRPMIASSGYRKGLRTQDSLRQVHRLRRDFSMSSGYQAARSFVSRGLPFDALMAATDLMAIGAVKFFNSRVSSPGAVAVVGFRQHFPVYGHRAVTDDDRTANCRSRQERRPADC